MQIKRTKEMYRFERYVHPMVEDILEHDVQSIEHHSQNHFLAARRERERERWYEREISSTNFIEDTETRQSLFEMNGRRRIEWIGN